MMSAHPAMPIISDMELGRMKMKATTYMIAVYAVLVKNGKREIEELPEAYIIPVAEYLATQEEATNE